MNKKIVGSILGLIVIFALVAKISRKETAVAEEKPRQPQTVSVQTAASSKTLASETQFPATVVGDQEIKVAAKSAGTASGANFNVGDKISAGSLLAKIDDIGALRVGDNGFRNLQIQQSQIAVQQAKKAYDLAKDVYENIEDDDNSTSTQKDTAKAQVKITKLQYENATLELSGSIDNHLATSPISGVITSKNISNGDSVSAGQEIATISQSNKIKLQFFVDQKQRTALKVGQEIFATNSDGENFTFSIRNISVSADQATKRFLIEAYPKTATTLPSGTILTASIKSEKTVSKNNSLFLPLSAVSIGQNESYIFKAENNVAKKSVVEVLSVQGENVEISADLSSETLIIIEGSKLVDDGETISIK